MRRKRRSTRFVDQIKQVITPASGTVDKADKWGVRKLAYRVRNTTKGTTSWCSSRATPELVHEVERRMRVTDMVIKFITVRIDEKLKKIEKRKKAREKRAARNAPAPRRGCAPAAAGCAGDAGGTAAGPAPGTAGRA